MAAKSAPKSAADKLAEQDSNGTRTGANTPEPKPAAKPKPSKPKYGGLTKAQLTKAAAMRAEGATWNAIRAAFKVKLGLSAWFRAWEAQEIEHIPAGQRVKSKPAPKPAKPRRTVKRSKTAQKS